MLGVIAAGRDSVAILASDGKPAEAVGVDMEVASGVTVQEVNRQYVLLNTGGTVRRVDLPESAIDGLAFAGPASAGPAGMPAPAANTDLNRMASQQFRVQRPGGIGPAAFGAVPMPTPEPQPVARNQALMRNPMFGGRPAGY